MEDTLKGAFKEMWIEYQNAETAAVSDLSYDQLVERITKWESIEFEARAKRQKCLAEKRVRDTKIRESGRDALISNPKYQNNTDGPFSVSPDYKVKGPKAVKSSNGETKAKAKPMTKHEKLQAAMADLGLDLGDMLGDIQKKKNPNGD